MTKIAVFGASGFVGRACRASIVGQGHDVAALPAPRLARTREELSDPARDLLDPLLVAQVAETLHGRDVVVNAAGNATPRSGPTPALFGANSYWPQVVAHACELAGVRRLVHVSSAAVQGRVPTLDETQRYGPVSPYAESKVLGERMLAEVARRGRVQVTIYRPASVHGEGRELTRSFAAFCRRWPLIVADDGSQPVPVCLASNVGAAVATLTTAGEPPLVVIHPYEGHTVRTLYEIFAPGRRIRSVPGRAVLRTLRAAQPAGRRIPALAAAARRAELLLLGQAQAASWLTGQGFVPPSGRAEWARIARAAAL